MYKALSILDLILHVLYITCLLIISVNFDVYITIYPDVEQTYICKLIISSLLVGSRLTSLINHNNILYYIIMWVSMISLFPDTIRCILL